MSQAQVPRLSALRTRAERALARLNALLGYGLMLSVGLIVVVGISAGALAFGFLNSAPPTTLTMSGGPDGSAFRVVAEQYRKILAREGVTLKILASEGSRENLARLADPKRTVDVGFVVGGETADADAPRLVSLGSLSYQPLMIFRRAASSLRRSSTIFRSARTRHATTPRAGASFTEPSRSGSRA